MLKFLKDFLFEENETPVGTAEGLAAVEPVAAHADSVDVETLVPDAKSETPAEEGAVLSQAPVTNDFWPDQDKSVAEPKPVKVVDIQVQPKETVAPAAEENLGGAPFTLNIVDGGNPESKSEGPLNLDIVQGSMADLEAPTAEEPKTEVVTPEPVTKEPAPAPWGEEPETPAVEEKPASEEPKDKIAALVAESEREEEAAKDDLAEAERELDSLKQEKQSAEEEGARLIGQAEETVKEFLARKEEEKAEIRAQTETKLHELEEKMAQAKARVEDAKAKLPEAEKRHAQALNLVREAEMLEQELAQSKSMSNGDRATDSPPINRPEQTDHAIAV